MDYKIREATQDDFHNLIILFKEFATFEQSPEKMKNSVERMVREQDFFNCFLIELPDGKLIGYAAYFFCYFTWTGKTLFLDDLYVQPQYRGNGIGLEIMNKVINFAKEKGCHKMRWQVSHWNNKAMSFYKKLGAEISQSEYNCDLILQ